MPDAERKAANRAKRDQQISDIADALMHASTVIAGSQREVERSQQIRRDADTAQVAREAKPNGSA